MNSNEAREYFNSKGLTYGVLTALNVDLLASIVQQEILLERKIDPECILRRINAPVIKKIRSTVCAFLTVKGTYFNDREAISFNPDGFIGFCGWASSKNSEPFINGFVKWCDAVKEA